MAERYPIILADPPWEHDNYGMAKHGAAKANYSESPLQVLSRIPVADFAEKACALLLWCTGPQAADGVHHELMKAWGFRCRTKAFTWVKVRPECRACGHDFYEHEQSLHDLPGPCGERECRCSGFSARSYAGTGNYTMGGVEDVWLGIRGSGLSKARLVKDVRNIVMAPPPCYPGTRRTRHSAKPEQVQDRIERLWPGPFLELFATRQREGWDCWGTETGVYLDHRGAHKLQMAEGT